MAASLGSASLILSTNAKALNEGLAKAKEKIGQFASSAAGVVSSIFSAFSLPDLSGLEIPEGIRGGIETVSNSVTSLGDAWNNLKNEFLSQNSGAISEIFARLSSSLQTISPLMNLIGRAALTTFEIFSQVGEMVAKSFMDGLSYLGLFSDKNASVEETVTGFWKNIAKGFGYAWDTLRAGLGVVQIVAAFLVQGFGRLVDAFRGFVDLAKQLPDEIRPGFIDSFSASLDRLGATLDGAGNKLRDWGEANVLAFGQSSTAIDEWFKNRKRLDVAPPPTALAEMGNAGSPASFAALQLGSVQEYQVRTQIKAEMDNKNALEWAKKQLAEQKKTNEILAKTPVLGYI